MIENNAIIAASASHNCHVRPSRLFHYYDIAKNETFHYLFLALDRDDAVRKLLGRYGFKAAELIDNLLVETDGEVIKETL